MTAPITSALRRLMTAEGARVTADRDEFCGICDALDDIHARKAAALEASTRRVDELCKENEKLRGLVRDMMRFFEDGDYCTVCEVERECTANEQYNDDCLMRDVFHDRMMELVVDG